MGKGRGEERADRVEGAKAMMVKVKEEMWEKWGDCGERARMKACTGLWENEKERRA